MTENSAQQLCQDLLDFIDNSPSPWHACQTVSHTLIENGFIQLFEAEPWNLQYNHNYFVIRDETSIIAFSMGGKSDIAQAGFRIIGSHIDSPTLRIKPNPVQIKNEIVRLGIETYGGAILATFADRDLSLAGRVVCKSDKTWLGAESQLIKFDAPLLRIPNLAIHMNREVNEKGLLLDKYSELPPVMAVIQNELPEQNALHEMIANKIDVKADEILSWELNVFDTQKGAFYGSDKEFYANSQIDNLASVHASLEAMVNSKDNAAASINICAIFDHEEVGSATSKGAAGTFLKDVMQRIGASQNITDEGFKRAVAQSILLSADMAHAYHPGFASFYDDDNKVLVNKGPAIKINSNQRYSTDGLSEAFFINLCEKANSPYQRYVHRANLPCGSTLGPILSTSLGIRSIDIGNPIWSMHSIRESAGTQDHKYITDCFNELFK